MVHLFDYSEYVVCSEENTELMARIGLNRLFNAKRYPVDLSELNALNSIDGSVVYGFLAWCASDLRNTQGWTREDFGDLLHIARLQTKRKRIT